MWISFAYRLISHFGRLPVIIGYLLGTLNFSPVFVYGFRYWWYKNLLRKKNESVFQFDLLLNIINSVKGVVRYYDNINFYKISSVEDFKSCFPLINKDVVRDNFDAFKNNNANCYDTVTTAGTTGKPMKIFLPKNRFVVEYATLHYHWEKVGYRFHFRAVLRNHKFSPFERPCRINPITKEMIFNNFDNSDKNYFYVYRMIRRYKIRFLHAYPSGAFEFFSFLKKQSLDLPYLRVVLMSSENILDYQRELIEGYFKKKIFGFYGHSEKLVFAGSCPNSSLYHVDLSYGFFELLDENANDIKVRGGVGEIVGSSYHNAVMPLMRYKTGDYAEYYGHECPHCKYKGLVLSHILGRWNGDKIYNIDGTFVTTTALNLHSDLYDKIDGLQYRQKEKGKLEVCIIPNKEFSDKTEQELRTRYKEAFKSSTEIQINKVDQLVKQPNGKFLLLIKD